MAWRHAMRPAWFDAHPYMTIHYRASGLSSTAFPLLRLRTFGDNWFTALSSTAVMDDGLDHVATIDLRTLSSAAQVITIKLQLTSGDSGASFSLTKLQFSDEPPGFRFEPVPQEDEPVSGYTLDTADAEAWQAKPEWLSASNIATDFDAFTTDGFLRFEVNEPRKGMKWRFVPSETISSVDHSFVTMRYRCEGMKNPPDQYAVWLSNGTDDDRPFYLTDLEPDGLWHTVAAPTDLESVTQLAIQVQSNTDSAWLEIASLEFLSSDPRIDPTFDSSLRLGWDLITEDGENFQVVQLSSLYNLEASQFLPRIGQATPWFAEGELTAHEQVPFRVEVAQSNLVATEMEKTGVIDVPIDLRTSEIYLLVAPLLPGREIPGSTNRIGLIDEVERFVAEVVYTDGGIETFFPVELESGLHRIGTGRFSPLVIPANPSRRVSRLRLHDRTDGGCFALAALTARVAGSPIHATTFDIPEPLHYSVAPMPPDEAPVVELQDGRLVLRNGCYRYEFDLTDGFRLDTLDEFFGNTSVIAGNTDGRFFSCIAGDTMFTSGDFVVGSVGVETVNDTKTVTVPLHIENETLSLSGELRAVVTSSPEVSFTLTLQNSGTEDVVLETRWPDLEGITLADQDSPDWYAFPRQTFVTGSRDINMEELYSGRFPMQFMDVFDPAAGWGLSLLVEDQELIHKYFGLRKSGGETALWIRYPQPDGRKIESGEAIELASFSLHFHSGDWKKAMGIYRDWVDTWYTPVSSYPEWFRHVYSCRRNYPVGGTGYLFDRARNEYTMSAELRNSTGVLGSVDMIDISSWAWSATHGRVGDYLSYELGGIENFSSNIEESRNVGVPVGLYLEGYLVDSRSPLYQEHGEEWRILRSDGEPIINGKTEVVFCPHVSEWQRYLSETYVSVADRTGADAMYIDVFGMAFTGRSCYHPEHEHRSGEPPLRGEAVMTKRIREALNGLNPEIALYTEYTPVDVVSQYQDGSFAYSIWSGDSVMSPTETNLFRFCFPEFKQIELVNGLFHAMNWTEEGLKKAFLNGEGIWIKGDMPSWYDARTLSFYRRSQEIFQDHRDAFAAPSPDPFYPTLFGEVYAHRFPSENKEIFTFYNGNRRNVEGTVVSLSDGLRGLREPGNDLHVVDLWRETMLEAEPGEDGVSISLNLPPRDIGCVGVFPARMNCSLTNGILKVSTTNPAEDAGIQLVGTEKWPREVHDFPLGNDDSTTFSLSSLFAEVPARIVVKLVEGGLVKDVVIVDTDPSGNPTGFCFN